MKKTFLLTMSVLLLISTQVYSNEALEKESTVSENALRIMCSPDLYDLANQWAIDFGKLNPNFKISVSLVDPNDLQGILQMDGNLGLISNRCYQSFENKSFWKVVIGREVIVPIINSKNPFLEQINQQGISSKELADAIKDPNLQNWKSLLENVEYIPVNYYSISDESIKSKIASFLDLNRIEVKGIEVANNQELVTAIQNDPNGIGFCRLTDVIDQANHSVLENIQLLPIDKNANGQIDYFEKIYANLNDFIRGVWIGKYPKSLINDIYAISNSIPKNESELAFLDWLITDGQRHLEQSGLTALVNSERQAKLEKLSVNKTYAETTKERFASQKIILLAFIALVAIAFAVNFGIRRRKNNISGRHAEQSDHVNLINENAITIPNGVFYDKTHTWVFMEKDGIVKLGIDDFLQHVTGQYTRVKIKNPGDKIKRNEPILTLVQNGKHLNIYAPISGTIKDYNEILITNPSLLNSSPYTDGWVYMIEPANWLREIQFLIMAGKYKEWLKDEFIRVKDFLAASVNPKNTEFSYVTLQEGGELTDNVLENFGPEVWEDFQKHFIDISELR
jgi:glycine cleavage system H lipoate-binding protein/ABC-type phosphate transport system substrate-binding protein